MLGRHSRNKRIVVIGGGTGVFTVLSGLKSYFNDLTAIVTMADDGGSSGILREDFGMLPPGDIRRALVALSYADNVMLAKLFSYRFAEGRGLTGHSFGNLMLTALHRITGDFERAIFEAGKFLSVRGNVIPVTLTPTTLNAELNDGTIVRGETNIDISNRAVISPVSRVWLTPHANINPRASAAIHEADAIIIGPGDLYTSIVPNLLVRGMNEALRHTRGKLIYITNLMTKRGETDHFSASDFLRVVMAHLGNHAPHYIVVNTTRPTPGRLRPYSGEGADFVPCDIDASFEGPVLVTADLLRSRGFLRHDPEKIARLIRMLI